MQTYSFIFFVQCFVYSSSVAKLGKSNSLQILYSLLECKKLLIQHWKSKEAASLQNWMKYYLNMERTLAEDSNKTNQFNKLWSTIYECCVTSHLEAFVSSVVVFCYSVWLSCVCVCLGSGGGGGGGGGGLSHWKQHF